jgi:hypothetical protein
MEHGVVFLLFNIGTIENSFNMFFLIQITASDQFYGITKMMGLVDFQRTVDY